MKDAQVPRTCQAALEHPNVVKDDKVRLALVGKYPKDQKLPSLILFPE